MVKYLTVRSCTKGYLLKSSENTEQYFAWIVYSNSEGTLSVGANDFNVVQIPIFVVQSYVNYVYTHVIPIFIISRIIKLASCWDVLP